MNQLFTSLLTPFNAARFSKMFASTGKGRWFPQPLDEMSRHRTRPPQYGMTRRSRVLCVDNSEIAKEANMSGKLAYIIWVYKDGYRKRHMPKAELGDRVLVAIRGEMKRAVVVGCKQHYFIRKHGMPATDTNNVVLLNNEGNPLGNRVLAPVPAYFMRYRKELHASKVSALVKKFI
uniref:Large ribosomal subunit protein uL14 n=1 Tax=Globodera rostochiensis TaxID=31243 RepID=A0A914H2Z8_GLORO